jgi:hypothetical protein
MAITRKARPSATDDLILTDAERAATMPAAIEPLTDAGADTSVAPTPVENPPATGEVAKPTPSTAPRTAAGGHPFRRHEIPFGDGKLILEHDGSIRTVAADGSVTATWQPDDPEWSRHAIRFGLRPSAAGGSSVPGHPPQRAKRPRI